MLSNWTGRTLFRYIISESDAKKMESSVMKIIQRCAFLTEITLFAYGYPLLLLFRRSLFMLTSTRCVFLLV